MRGADPTHRLSASARETLGRPTTYGGAEPNFAHVAGASTKTEADVKSMDFLLASYRTVESQLSETRGRTLKEGKEIIKKRAEAALLQLDVAHLERRVEEKHDKVSFWDRLRFDIPKEVENAPEVYAQMIEERKGMFEENTGQLKKIRDTIDKRTSKVEKDQPNLLRRTWDFIRRQEDFSVGQRMGRGLGAAGVAAVSGTTAGLFGAVGGIAGGTVRTAGMIAAETVKAASRAAGELIGGIIGGIGGAIVGFFTGGMAGVLKGAVRGAVFGIETGGPIGEGLGEVAAAGIQASAGAMSELTTAVSTMTGAAIDTAVPIYYKYEKQHTQMSALIRSGMHRTVAQNLQFGYSHGQTMQIMEQYARITGSTEGSQQAMRFSRMYGVDPEKAVEVATIARRAGIIEGYRGVLQRIAGATHRAGMGTGRIGEQITSLFALSDLSMRAVDELGPAGMQSMIGTQAYFAQFGEAYRGQYGVQFMGTLQGGMTQNQDPFARAMMWRAAGREGGTLGEHMKRYEAGVFDPAGGAIGRLVKQVQSEYGDENVQKYALHQALPGVEYHRIERLLEAGGAGEDTMQMGEEEAERAQRIGQGEIFIQEIEAMNIGIGASMHGLLEEIMVIHEELMNMAKGALEGDEEGVDAAVDRLGVGAKGLMGTIEKIGAGLAHTIEGISPEDLKQITSAETMGELGAMGWFSGHTIAVTTSEDEEDFHYIIDQLENRLGLVLDTETKKRLAAGERVIFVVGDAAE